MAKVAKPAKELVANSATETQVSNIETSVVTKKEYATTPEFSNREWLENNDPIFDEDVTSKKFDAIREPEVQAGLVAIQKLGVTAINPLVMLLAKWWEVKPARAAIKKMIDAEAAAKSTQPDFYLQTTLRKDVDVLAEVQTAVDRLRYSITYFKPRQGINVKDAFKPLMIHGIAYNVNLRLLAEAKEKFGDDKAALQDHIISISTPFEAIDEI